MPMSPSVVRAMTISASPDQTMRSGATSSTFIVATQRILPVRWAAALPGFADARTLVGFVDGLLDAIVGGRRSQRRQSAQVRTARRLCGHHRLLLGPSLGVGKDGVRVPPGPV